MIQSGNIFSSSKNGRSRLELSDIFFEIPVNSANGSSIQVNGTESEVPDPPKENPPSSTTTDGSQESVARSSVVSLQSSRSVSSKISSPAKPIASTESVRKKTKKSRKSAWYNVVSPLSVFNH